MAQSPGSHEVLIVGGGHSGLLLALALARSGIAVTLLEREPLDGPAPPCDGRALALMRGAQRVLASLGLWPLLAEIATPVWSVQVRDAATGAEMRYEAAEVGDEPFGYGITHSGLRERLLQASRVQPGITLLAPASVEGLLRNGARAGVRLADGRELWAGLIIGADGRGSRLRALAGIEVTTRPYHQTALTFAMRHDEDHGHRVREYLRPAGPLALLPIGARITAVTWVERPRVAERLLAGPPAQLLAALAERTADAPLPRALVGRPQAYPLAAQIARRTVAPSLALIGDAAHGLHPIHAQGFNLGVRDIAALAELLVDARRRGLAPGDAETLCRYERWRRQDAGLTAGLTDGLNRLFANQLPPVLAARRLGFAMLQRVPGLKRAAMTRGMGLAGDLPKLARGEPLT